MARELGVELAQLEGSGPGGRIVKADVQAAGVNGGGRRGRGGGGGREAREDEVTSREEGRRRPRRRPRPAKEAQRGEAARRARWRSRS